MLQVGDARYDQAPGLAPWRTWARCRCLSAHCKDGAATRVSVGTESDKAADHDVEPEPAHRPRATDLRDPRRSTPSSSPSTS